VTMLAAHQPNFLPWIGYFHKMAKADVFVLLNEAQVSKNSYANRVKIKGANHAFWLTLPMGGDWPYSYQDAQVRDRRQVEKVRRAIVNCYGKARYYDHTVTTILAGVRGASLAAINGVLIRWAHGVLGLDTEIVLQSDLGIVADKTTLIQDLCKAVGADTYLSGQGARKYNDPAEFGKLGINLGYDDFECPEYPQLWGDFIPNLSVIDLLFNCGPHSREVLLDE